MRAHFAGFFLLVQMELLLSPYGFFKIFTHIPTNTTKYNFQLSNFEQHKEVQLKTQLKCLCLPTDTKNMDANMSVCKNINSTEISHDAVRLTTSCEISVELIFIYLTK